MGDVPRHELLTARGQTIRMYCAEDPAYWSRAPGTAAVA